jgi:hypothetical protein
MSVTVRRYCPQCGQSALSGSSQCLGCGYTYRGKAKRVRHPLWPLLMLACVVAAAGLGYLAFQRGQQALADIEAARQAARPQAVHGFFVPSSTGVGVTNGGPLEWTDVTFTLRTSSQSGAYHVRAARIPAGQRMEIVWSSFLTSRGVAYDSTSEETPRWLDIQCATPGGRGAARINAAAAGQF